MQRVVIVGAGGSGKTVLACRLGALFGLPVVHLDGLFYDRDFNPVPAREFAAAQERLIRAGAGSPTGTTPRPCPCAWAGLTRSCSWICRVGCAWRAWSGAGSSSAVGSTRPQGCMTGWAGVS